MRIILLLILPFIVKSQVTVDIWSISAPVCPGDSVKVHFKIGNPSFTNQTINFIMKSPATYTIAWTGNSNLLYLLPKETFPPMPVTDSCSYIWLHVPINLGSGTFTLQTPQIAPSTPTFAVKPLPNITVPTNTICFGNGYIFNPSGADTYTYSSGKLVIPTVTTTYTVSGTLNGCTASKEITVKVLDCSTGIIEYSPNLPDIKYYDIYGKETPVKENEFLIWRSGKYSGKVIQHSQ